MNFQQLRFLNEAIKNDFSLTSAAQNLYTSQSGVSKQIIELESELGIEIFVRRGKRIIGLTTAGEGIAEIAGRILLEANNLKKYSQSFVYAHKGKLSIATTHNQARHILPHIIKRFSELYPEVSLDIKQCTPKEAAILLAYGEVDIAIATEALDDNLDIICFPCFRWHHILIIKKGDILEDKRFSDIKELAHYPIVTYSHEFSGRGKIDKAFDEAGLEPDIRFTTMDSDIIKTYVEVGLGVGIVAEMARPASDSSTLATNESALGFFEQSTTKLALRRGALIQKFVLDFAGLLVPALKDSNLKAGPKIARDLEKFHDNSHLHNIPDYAEWRKIFIDTY